MQRLLVFAVIAAAVLAGCGDSDGAPGAGCQGVQLTSAQLCTLTCGATTHDQAIALLGTPTQAVTGLISYNYVCPSGDLLGYSLFFDSQTGVLTHVAFSGAGRFAAGSVPACLAACR